MDVALYQINIIIIIIICICDLPDKLSTTDALESAAVPKQDHCIKMEKGRLCERNAIL